MGASVAELEASIATAGGKVKELKTNKAPADEIKAAVDELLALKKEITALDPAHPQARRGAETCPGAPVERSRRCRTERRPLGAAAPRAVCGRIAAETQAMAVEPVETVSDRDTLRPRPRAVCGRIAAALRARSRRRRTVSARVRVAATPRLWGSLRTDRGDEPRATGERLRCRGVSAGASRGDAAAPGAGRPRTRRGAAAG